MRSKFLKRFGICLFSILTVFAAGIFPAASAHYNGDHIDFTSSGDYFVLNMIPTPVREEVDVYTNSSGVKFRVRVSYTEGVNGRTNLWQRYIGGSNGSTASLSSGRLWNVTLMLPYIAGTLSKVQFLDYLAKTNFVALSFEFDIVEDQAVLASKVIPDTSVMMNGAKFVIAQQVGDLVRYSWVYSYEGSVIDADSLIDNLFDGTTPNVDGDVPFVIPFKSSGTLAYDSLYKADLGVFTFTNNPEGALLPDADSTTIIVEGLDNLGDAIDTSISAGVTEITSVVSQQTNAITGSIESQTEAILNYRSDVDMSISENAEVATKLAEESLINQQIYDGYVTPEYDTNVGDTIDQNFGDGVGFLSDAMQMIFDFGVGNLVLVLLTIGTSLFIIGRSMR